jgi:predicted DNA-binding transcriptional regulator YafY
MILESSVYHRFHVIEQPLIIKKSNQKLLTSVIPTKTTLKTKIPDIHQNIEKTLEAISKQVRIKFQYTDIQINENKKAVKVLRYDGLKYLVNPYFLVWRKEQYYLICNNDKYDDLSYYRVDRITNLQVQGQEKIKSISELLPNGTSDEIIGEFVDKSFYQFIGEKTRLTIRCFRWMLEELIDYFGNDLIISKVEEEMIEVSVGVRDGEGLYYWILQHGSNMEVISPIEIRQEVKKRLKNTLKLYK